MTEKRIGFDKSIAFYNPETIKPKLVLDLDEIGAGVFPQGASDASVPCEVLEGPTASRCSRAHDLLSFSISDPDALATFRAKLGVTTTFNTTVICSHGAQPADRTTTIGCVEAVDAGHVTTDDGGTSMDSGCP